MQKAFMTTVYAGQALCHEVARYTGVIDHTAAQLNNTVDIFFVDFRDFQVNLPTSGLNCCGAAEGGS